MDAFSSLFSFVASPVAASGPVPTDGAADVQATQGPIALPFPVDEESSSGKTFCCVVA